MGKRVVERLHQSLGTHMSNIHETLQILDQKPASSLQKVSWDEAIKIGEQVSKHATTAGMLFTEVQTEVKALEENMGVYFNALQGLLLLAYGSTVGAGPTLSSSIHASIKNVVDCSFKLWCECVSSYGSQEEQKHAIPPLVGTVWDACSALKKTPATNITAIGREMTRVAVSIKDVLREMKELEPSPSDATNEVSESDKGEGQAHGSGISDDDDDDNDLGKDLSPEEMKVAQLAIGVVSEVVNVVKELIRSITGLLRKGGLVEEKDGVESLEELLTLCRGVGVLVDELGACLYPPQEYSAIKKACEDISSRTDDMEKVLGSLNGSVEAFSQCCKSLKKALDLLVSEISNSTAADIEPQMQNLAVGN